MKAVLILCVVVAAVMAAPQGRNPNVDIGPVLAEPNRPGYGGQGGRYVNGVHVVDQAPPNNNGVNVVESPDNGSGVNSAGYPAHLGPGTGGVNSAGYPAHLGPGNGGVVVIDNVDPFYYQPVGQPPSSNPNIDIGPVLAYPPVPGGTWNRPIRPRPGVHPGARDGK